MESSTVINYYRVVVETDNPYIELCRRNPSPEYCPGLAVAKRLLKNLDRLSECRCREIVDELMEKPWSYTVGVLAGVSCRTGKCLEHGRLEKDKVLNPKTYENTIQLISELEKHGYRILDIIYDVELVHVVVHAGCGQATYTCSPEKCYVVDTEGVEASSDPVVIKCSDKPPYLGETYLKSLLDKLGEAVNR